MTMSDSHEIEFHDEVLRAWRVDGYYTPVTPASFTEKENSIG